MKIKKVLEKEHVDWKEKRFELDVQSRTKSTILLPHYPRLFGLPGRRSDSSSQDVGLLPRGLQSFLFSLDLCNL
jgi:hypothetical protein